ncbi:MAG: type II secretion system major pseudopilin GspG [Epsilonproteobacteria bacterium]|nr:type II secretion system major pseudopilin GspG [Campylobacterota bacterium]
MIIALLSSLIAPKFFKKLDNAKIKTTRAQLELTAQALDSFRLDVGRYPTTQEGLKVLWEDHSQQIKGWDGPYLPKPLKKDAWGNPYVYKSPGSGSHPYELMSLGADGKVGGTGNDKDLSVWDSE